MNEDQKAWNTQNNKVVNDQAEVSTTRPKKKKTPATIYLTEEAELAFTELYIHRLRKDRKIDRSMIACEAILALYKKQVATISS